MKSFEERLTRLEQLTASIKSPATPLDAALAQFEEGIQLAQGLEKELDKMEKKVEILLNPGNLALGGNLADPTFDLFSELPKAP
ncbi:MAG: exodeoxyribonuclease VII small subunit [Spirochaetales bacterium]